MPLPILKDYLYELPDARIARFPVSPRDHAKLLCYKQGHITHRAFYDLPTLLPPASSLFFNNTKVIPARMFFQKPSGGVIELFLLKPIAPFAQTNDAMQARGECVWECTIGNLKRWNDGLLLHTQLPKGNGFLSAELVNREKKQVRLRWSDSTLTFSELLVLVGEIPLPPYLNREPVEADKETYQTVYSSAQGAVAAPTAGLHFTENLLKTLQEKSFLLHELTLHVSAGTFRPIKVDNVTEHDMHSEQVVVSRRNVADALQAQSVVAVGTTSVRTLESLYWYGVHLCKASSLEKEMPFRIEKLAPYVQEGTLPSRKEALQAVGSYMDTHRKTQLVGDTSIFIFPGYTFRLCDGLITNFHQPGSTLILLIASFLGENWRTVYQAALENDYRFLSYGDSSLLLP